MAKPKGLPSLAAGRPSAQSVDDWVTGAHPAETAAASPAAAERPAQPAPAAPATDPQGEPLKRLTLDIPLSLHAAIKTDCARRGVKMIDDIRPLLEAHYGPLRPNQGA
ncbi:3-oxoacyl-ACP reductase-like protein [Tsukamurella ocularis]|uniref:hypothetical protein n=1 Tax=Tsukamurella ocularis TaxID=1970234 RepID=UPI0021672841|nr:hypothetical protein [Tsukamurella ocularis]MCS3789966.1 3-oxoacyl-ACP reductase-like protein [Tsukamurella ocularis]